MRRLAIAGVLAAAFAAPDPAAAVKFTVTTGAASGDGQCDASCTFVEAIDAANAAGGPDEIAFDVGGGGSVTLTDTALPVVTGAVTIDGWTQPGDAGGPPIVEFPGTLGVAAADSTVRGLRLQQLATTSAADRLTLRGSILANELGLEGVTDAVIGGTATGEGNRLAALTLYAGSTGATIRGNEFTGTVLVQSTASATIGGTTDAARNRLAGGPLARVDVARHRNDPGNWIGLGATGGAAAQAANYGVYVESGATVQVGGGVSGAGNVIAGSGVGVEVQGTATHPG